MQVNTKLELLTNYMMDKKVVNTGTMNLQRKYGVTLPLKTLNEFDQFETRLISNAFFKHDVVSKFLYSRFKIFHLLIFVNILVWSFA